SGRLPHSGSQPPLAARYPICPHSPWGEKHFRRRHRAPSEKVFEAGGNGGLWSRTTRWGDAGRGVAGAASLGEGAPNPTHRPVRSGGVRARESCDLVKLADLAGPHASRTSAASLKRQRWSPPPRASPPTRGRTPDQP